MKRIILMAGLLMITAVMAQAQLKREYGKTTSTAPVYSVTVSPDIPMTVNFAGETVSFDRLDMAERLDRELTGIIYGQTTTELCFKRANRYFPALAKILKEQGVPLDFLYLAVTESSMDYNAYSSAKAAGMWQLLAGTGRDYGLEVGDEVDERYDPEKSTVAACKYLKAAYKKYGHWPTVAASYNAGMQKISNELSKQQVDDSFDLYLVQETSRYVFRIIAYKLVMESPKRYGYRFSRKNLWQPVAYTTVDVTGSVASWVDWAKSKGITYAQLREANPWIRSTKLTNAGGKTYKVRIPKSSELYRSKRTFSVYNKDWVID
jgi:hypothetical protein